MRITIDEGRYRQNRTLSFADRRAGPAKQSDADWDGGGSDRPHVLTLSGTVPPDALELAPRSRLRPVRPSMRRCREQTTFFSSHAVSGYDKRDPVRKGCRRRGLLGQNGKKCQLSLNILVSTRCVPCRPRMDVLSPAVGTAWSIYLATPQRGRLGRSTKRSQTSPAHEVVSR
jgi:hypothetical protein